MTTETKLINQGSYGCIYYPSLPFKLKKNTHSKTTSAAVDTTRKSYVSKLQKHNFHSEFEDYIGKKIQDIPSFDIFFVPVLTTYKIDLATIKESYVTDCEAISKYIKRSTHAPAPAPAPAHAHATAAHKSISSDDYKTLNKKFIMQKMKYIDGLYLHRHLLQAVVNTTKTKTHDRDSDSDRDSDHDHDHDRDSDRDSDDTYISKTLRKDERQIKKYRSEFKQEETESSYNLMSIAFDLYERIMDSIQLLIQYKIVHYDLKENNILVEKTQQLPYIIDFGLSIDVERLLQHQWSDKAEEESRTKDKSKDKSRSRVTIDSNVLYSSGSSKIFKDNYLWKQHFYIHAPDYFLWPIEVHLMTYLINEHDTLTEESLNKICFEYISNNRAIEYMSREFKKKMFKQSVNTFSRFIHQPREKVLNELLKYWDKWDMYAINIMFLKIMYELIFHREAVTQDQDQDQDQDRDQDQDQYPDRDQDPDQAQDQDQERYPDPDRDPDRDPDQDPDRDPDKDQDQDRDPDQDRDRDPDKDRDISNPILNIVCIF